MGLYERVCRGEKQREGTTGTAERQGERVSHALCAPHGDPPVSLEVGVVSQLLTVWGKTARGLGVAKAKQHGGQGVGAEEVAVPPAGTGKALPSVPEGSGAAALARQHVSRNRRSSDGFRAPIFWCSP